METVLGLGALGGKVRSGVVGGVASCLCWSLRRWMRALWASSLAEGRGWRLEAGDMALVLADPPSLVLNSGWPQTDFELIIANPR
jgi:hypothetical protein